MSRRVIGIIIAILGIAVALVGVFSIQQILNVSLAPPASVSQALPETEKVIVVTRDFAVGDILDDESLRREDIPVGLIPRNAIRDSEDAIGRIVKVPLVSGELVLDHHLADPTNISHDIGFTMSENMVMMAFPASDLMSSLDVLQRGDIVDILVTIEQEIEPIETVGETTETGSPGDGTEEPEEVKRRQFTFDALQAVGISAVIADIEYAEGSYANVPLGSEDELVSSENPPPSEVKVRAYLLVVNPQDALVLKHLIDSGGIFDLVLRAPTSDQLFNLQPVMPEYLIDRYQLDIPR